MSGRLTVAGLIDFVNGQKLSHDTEIVIVDAAGDEIDLPTGVEWELDESGDDPQIYVSINKDVSEPAPRAKLGVFGDEDEDFDKANEPAITSLPTEAEVRTALAFITTAVNGMYANADR